MSVNRTTDGLRVERVSSHDAMVVARAILDVRFETPSGRLGLWFWQGAYYAWRGGRWRVLSVEDVVDEIFLSTEGTRVAWMVDAGVEKSEPLGVGLKEAGAIERSLKAICKWRKPTVPAWVGLPAGDPREEWDPELCIAFRDKVVYVGGEKVETCERDEMWFGPAMAECDYEEGAECPTWMKCLMEWGLGSKEWEEAAGTVAAQVVLPKRYGTIAALVGKTRGGKGLFSRTLYKGLGDPRLVMAVGTDDFGSEHGLGGLYKVMVLDVSETEEMGKRVAGAMARTVKRVAGKDPMRVNDKWGQVVEFVPQCLCVLSANSIPQIPDKNKGVSSKLMVLPFDVSFADRPDTGLEKTLERELPGVMAWAVRHAHALVGRVRAGELGAPRKRTPAAEKYWRDFTRTNNPWAAFLEDGFIEDPKGEAFVPRGEVWARWLTWKEESGVKVVVNEMQLMRALEMESGWAVVRAQSGRKETRGLRGLRGAFLKVRVTQPE